MIKKTIVAVAIIAASMVHCIAQTDDAATEKKYDHYIGFQANELMKQLINLNNSNTAITNPYLLTYYINANKCGWGVNIGLGYNYQDSKDVNSPVGKESKINNLFYRIGFGRRMMISKRFEMGYSLDIIGDNQNDQTFSQSVNITGFSTTIVDSSFTNTSTKTTSMGVGPQFYLGFHLSNRVILGTEASYYFISSKQKQNVTVKDNITDNTVNPPAFSSTIIGSNTETDISKFSLSLPVAIFLILKF